MTRKYLPRQTLSQWADRENRPSSPSTNPSPIAPTPGGQQRLGRHPLSQAFGDLPRAVREELIAKIRQSGQVREIITLNGQVLLGWDSYDAATELGLPVRLEPFSGTDPWAFVVANSLHQRHWDAGQRAVITVRLYAWQDRGRPEKSVPNTDLSPPEDGSEVAVGRAASSAEMAETARVGVSYVTRAKRVQAFGLGEAVLSGEMSLAEAHRRVKLVTDAGLADGVRSGEVMFDAAHASAKVVADAGLLMRVTSGQIDFDEAHHLALAGETGEVEHVRPQRPTKAELVQRVEELERENRCLADAAARATVAEARAAAAEAEVKRLTESLDRAGLAA